MTITQHYLGEGKSPDGSQTFSYIADSGLRDAVNMAIMLERPLLIKGEPGSGKTKLAASIAFELGISSSHFFCWRVKSTSLARDGLYRIDVIRRLQDAQMQEISAKKLVNYVQLGPLGEAIRIGVEEKKATIVLIDEIDKADIDFPNDLLYEIDEKGFEITELLHQPIDDSDLIKPSYQNPNPPPIIIITSNDEKELPDAFLRRCLFYYIPFPTGEYLQRIVEVNLHEIDPELELDNKLVELAIERLHQIRISGNLRKNPATSELIDWILLLHHWDMVKAKDLLENAELSELPCLEAVLKHQQDLQLLDPKEIFME